MVLVAEGWLGASSLDPRRSLTELAMLGLPAPHEKKLCHRRRRPCYQGW